jgi:uncharacterized protein (TIGR03435 family)
MKTLAGDLTQCLHRSVVDKTGLTKRYQVALDVSMEDMRTIMSKQSFPGGGFGARCHRQLESDDRLAERFTGADLRSGWIAAK